METIITFSITDKDANKTVQQFLKEKEVSSTLLKMLKREGRIRVNDKSVHVEDILSKHDILTLHLPEESSEQLVPEPIPFEVLYEDDDLLVVNKPAGIAVHPTFNHASGTLANGIVHYWHNKGVRHCFRAINRLDKDTTGIVVIALHVYAYNRLTAQYLKHTINKKYIACVHGNIQQDEGEINLPIGRKDSSIIEREVRFDGQPAITKFRVLKRLQDISVLELTLLTGRTHQIRVHMSHIGHPLVGDDLYGGLRNKIYRQALHAYSISFMHPRTNELIQLQAPIPNDIQQLYQNE